MPLYLTEDEVGGLLTPADAYAAVEGSFRRLFSGAVDNRLRERLELPDGKFATMACVDPELGFAGLKTYAWASAGTPFLVVLFQLDGRLEAIVEAERLSRFRTAAASAVAASHLARAGATSLGVFGSGRQAAAHIVALRDALPALDRVVVQARDPRRLAEFCREHGCEPAEEPRDAAACDVVVTVTTSPDPVLRGEWLEPGAFVLRRRRERPRVPRARQRRARAGDASSAATRARSRARRREISPSPSNEGCSIGSRFTSSARSSPASWRDARATTTSSLFKSNGLAAWDLAVGARVVELARERGSGREL